MSNRVSLESDLQAIATLNQHDIDAVLASDVAAIISQWTDDFVVLPAAGPIVRGRDANARIAEQGKGQIQAFEPLKFVVSFEEIQVLGDYAYEWGAYTGGMRPRAGGEVVRYSGKIMRILRRQDDGAWKMHRTMLSND